MSNTNSFSIGLNIAHFIDVLVKDVFGSCFLGDIFFILTYIGNIQDI